MLQPSLYRAYLPFLMCSIVLFGSCKKKEGEHLPPKKMEAVLYDITLAETFSTMSPDNSHTGGAKNTDSLAAYYRQIFARHHITQQQFTESMTWYKNHQEDLDSLYTNISAKADIVVQEENKRVNKK